MCQLLNDPKLAALVAQLPVLSGASTISILGGGLTNKNYKVETTKGICVMRVSDTAPALLGINRENEKINSQKAFEAGVGPAVIDALLQQGVLLVDWIDAKTLHPADLHGNTILLQRIAASLQMLHASHPFAGKFHFPSLRKTYLDTVLKNNYFIPAAYLDTEPLITALEEAIAANPEPLVSCNNDLLAENFMDDGKKIWIIDYEYSGMNEASFEIGNLSSESNLAAADIRTLCDAYWQQHRPEKIARARAWSMIARYGWMMWASIQSAVSTIDFDFKTWGIQKWESVLPELTSDEYHLLLRTIKQTHS